MAKKYRELQARMSPGAQALARDRATRMIADMPLQGLRQARRLSQETLADNLGISQPQVSKIEHSTDLYLSTLRRYVEAMGGDLEMVARFPEGLVRITQLQALEPEVKDA
jgi:transcriptional regulator with XRE-family HTH domain